MHSSVKRFRILERLKMDVIDVKELNGVHNDFQMNTKRKRDGRYIWNKFVEQSTLHGLHYVFEKRPILQRFIWFLLQGLMIALFLWQTLTLALDYLQYNVTSTIELVTEHESDFPAVTLCNFNMYRVSAINNSEFREFYEVLVKQHPLYKNASVTKKVDWTKYGKVNNLDMEDVIRRGGHQMVYDKATEKGMLYRCEWRGDLCNHTHFTPVLTDMGLCYSFNAGLSPN